VKFRVTDWYLLSYGEKCVAGGVGSFLFAVFRLSGNGLWPFAAVEMGSFA